MYGNNHLFIPGPTNVPEPVRQAMNIPMEDMRAPISAAFTKPLLADLKKAYRTETGTVFLYPSSGTGMWETAITNTLNVGDTVLMSRFGQFSLLWVDMADPPGPRCDLCEVEWGKGVPVEEYAEKLAADKEHQIKAVFATQNETATGVKSDIAAVRKALDDAGQPPGAALSSMASARSARSNLRWTNGASIAPCPARQKGFMLPAGLGILGVSAKGTGHARRCQDDRAAISTCRTC